MKNLLTVPVGIREHCGAGKIGGAHRGRGKEGKSFPRERFAGATANQKKSTPHAAAVHLQSVGVLLVSDPG